MQLFRKFNNVQAIFDIWDNSTMCIPPWFETSYSHNEHKAHEMDRHN